ncbi:hypothetical protein [Tahibacter soli]|uniref:Uncharacterized protein n=1 Tax=Tahibacter soli TaxID=2983605 RepID=A0A9X3YNI5_9GAMM|nr:hypothetical protein [Tahibacter soli]MDC8013998.1 hypothetical protein [Tahibacter soli]
MKICCDAMRAMQENVDGEGLFVRLVDDIRPFYVIEFRGIALKNEGEYRELLARSEFVAKLLIGERRPIEYCPWCGYDLRKYIADAQLNRYGLVRFLKKAFGYFGDGNNVVPSKPTRSEDR